jgi:alkylated DNA repair dioxygenase AlkB
MEPVQLSLLGREAPCLSHAGRVTRTMLDSCCWLEQRPGFVQGHAQLFAELQACVAFRAERRMMYEREVDVPRLVAHASIAAHPLLGAIAEHLRERYAAPITELGLALYRHGADSVAWHRDHMSREAETLVAIVALGAPRRLLVRPFGGGASRRFQVGMGDLFVMGGYCQRDWEHHVPKVSHAHARMSLMFRHVYERAPRTG